MEHTQKHFELLLEFQRAEMTSLHDKHFPDCKKCPLCLGCDSVFTNAKKLSDIKSDL